MFIKDKSEGTSFFVCISALLSLFYTISAQSVVTSSFNNLISNQVSPWTSNATQKLLVFMDFQYQHFTALNAKIWGLSYAELEQLFLSQMAKLGNSNS